MVASPKEFGSKEDCAGKIQQHVQKTDPTSRGGKPASNRMSYGAAYEPLLEKNLERRGLLSAFYCEDCYIIILLEAVVKSTLLVFIISAYFMTLPVINTIQYRMIGCFVIWKGCALKRLWSGSKHSYLYFLLIICYFLFFIDFCLCLLFPSQPHYGPGVDSASNRNEYQELIE
jgi:hypothetical protein